MTNRIQNVIATSNDKITVGSEGEKRQYELPKSNIERLTGSEVFLKISHAGLANYDLKKEDDLGKSWQVRKEALIGNRGIIEFRTYEITTA